MKTPIINQTVLMSDAEHFAVKELNLYSHEEVQPDVNQAKAEHAMVKSALQRAGIQVVQVDSPVGCQDGIYTANWAFCSGDIAVAAKLPNIRQGEQDHARDILKGLGKTVIVPEQQRYSGQGDSLVCGDKLFVGSNYRTDRSMHDFLEATFMGKRQPNYDIISVQTVPAIDNNGVPIINKVSNWPDSNFYDIDLAMGIVRPPVDGQPALIAWCPEAFTKDSQRTIRELDMDKIEVDIKEAEGGFACNFISTGHKVVMGSGAPQLQAAIESYGLQTEALEIKELIKGGGFIRCIALTLDNQ